MNILRSGKRKLEKEQGKLLATNVEMAIETKKLLLLQKEWKQEKSDLLTANSEFAEEVERLYKVEERWEEEKEEARREAEAARAGLQQELVEADTELKDEGDGLARAGAGNNWLGQWSKEQQ